PAPVVKHQVNPAIEQVGRGESPRVCATIERSLICHSDQRNCQNSGVYLMSIPATQMRPGMIIKHNDQLHVVFSVEHRTPGNLRAFIQAKLKNVRTGAMFVERFRSPDPIDRVKVDEIKMEFLYSDGDDYYFMDEAFEQTVLKHDTLGDAVEYLT